MKPTSTKLTIRDLTKIPSCCRKLEQCQCKKNCKCPPQCLCACKKFS